MLHGDKVTLRGRLEADVAVLDAELFGDVETFSRAAGFAWRPRVLGAASIYAETEPNDRTAVFSIVARETGELLGTTLLWGIDLHNRNAHVGITLRPGYRGQGFGTDTVRVICRYAFMVLGLHRLQLETLSDNVGMLRSAAHCGFVREGIHRESSWLDGAFVDDVSLGLLASEWVPSTDADA